mgnify:CR=1 FL=1
MVWTEDELNLAEKCGSAQMSLTEVILIFNHKAENDIVNGLSNKLSDFYQSFHRGRLLTEMQIREAIFEQAKNGSSPAQNLAVQLINDYKLASA